MSSVWAHLDARGMAPAIMQATARANAGDWTTKTADDRRLAVADFRALLLGSAASIYAASGTPIGTMELATVKALPAYWSTMVKDGDTATALALVAPITWTPDRASQRAAAVLVLDAWQALAERYALKANKGAPVNPYVYGCQTEGASAPAPLASSVLSPTAGNPIAIAAILAGSAALAYLGANAIDAYERHLSREKDSQRLATLTSAATTTLASHAQADQAAGKITPLSPAEQAVMAALTKQIADYKAATPSAPAPTDWGGFARDTTSSLVTPLVLLAGLYLLLKKGT